MSVTMKRMANLTMGAGEALDSSMDSMEETRFRKRHNMLALELSEKLHFSYDEIECLFLIFYKLYKDSKDSKFGIDKSLYRDVLHCSLNMTEDSLMNRIFFTLDRGPSSSMTMETWATSLSLLLRGTLDEKIKYCYKVYDTIGDSAIGRESMFYLLRNSVLSLSGEEDAEETVKEMIEVLTKKMDVDRDGKISYEDFRKTVLKQPMLLEAFGQCLPNRENAYTFLTTFTHKPGKL